MSVHLAKRLTAIALLLGLREAGAAEVSFVLHRQGAATSSFDLVLTNTGTPEAAPVRRTVDAEPSVKIALGRGEWVANVDSDGVWSDRQYLTIGSDDREIPIDVWPAGKVHGRVSSDAEEAPTQLDVMFEGNSTRGKPVRGETSCPLREGLFTCVLPAGTLDVRVRAAGHVARFFQDVSISPEQPGDLGAVTLHEGQSVVGRVELPFRSTADIRKTIIQASVRGTTTEAGPQLPGSGLIPQSTKADENGVFQLDGLRPGEYMVRATHPDGLTSTEIVVAVAERREVEVRRPLRLSTPGRIDVAIVPPAGPGGKLWHVDVSRYVGPDVLTPVSASLASFAGVWLSPPLAAGQYRITVGQDGSVWYRETISIDQGDVSRLVTLDGRVVRGRVRLGDKPIRASVAFSDDRGRRARSRSDEQGAFEVAIVDRNRRSWDVTVESETPAISRTIREVLVRDDGSVAIDLPDSTLAGSVVDEEGEPIPLALITVQSKAGEFMQTAASSAGRFSVHGLVSGQYEISAESQMHAADSLTIELDAEKPPSDVRLVGRRRRELRGRVLSSYGPVAGAQVVVRARNQRTSRLYPYATGAAGSFAVTIPHQASEFDVVSMSAGFAFQLDHLVYGKEPVTIRLNQRGGTLILRTSEPSPFLVRSGATMPLRLLQNRWPVEIETAADGTAKTIAPMMAPGSYALCSVPAANVDVFRNTGGAAGAKQCVAGVLDSLGTLTLELSQKR